MKFSKLIMLATVAISVGTAATEVHAAKRTIANSNSQTLTFKQITGNNLHRLGTIRQLTRSQIATDHKLTGKQVQYLMQLPLPHRLTAKNFTLDSQSLTMHLTKNKLHVSIAKIPLSKLTGIILNRYMPSNLRYKKPTATKQKVVALTFDDGPDPLLTPKLLKVLKKNNVPATFFEVGSSVIKYPQISRMVIQSGNQIGNHSWNHPQFTKIGKARAMHQISTTDAAIYKATGTLPAFVRPPYGAINESIGASFDRPTIQWDVDSLDWSYLNTPKTIKHVLTTTHNGSVILMHDIHPTSVAAVPSIIHVLKKRGYKFVTLEQLMQKPLLSNYQYFGRNDYRNL
ncbi:polysaccharide deacetylase family protein [Lentilactobacillus sp. SPB1-3]|uniref:Polysaccharide deacetylase family protein n=1 Tax=Lentilactobacillus terminaliae TaxID=3003483 RepID=A0ACD5DEP0_9LACO|nr:polysaccharide deacetylase family protein [Lentilactobacillus sp. SPB1-3]MCZ0976369.1 polysaccharide deacetylase family protein [Lentilactobacillus sp. SPB1-3]